MLYKFILLAFVLSVFAECDQNCEKLPKQTLDIVAPNTKQQDSPIVTNIRIASQQTQVLITKQPTETLEVVNKIKIKLQHLEAAKEIMKGLVTKTRQQPGNIRYDLYQDIQEAGVLILIERYYTLQDFNKHKQTEYFKTEVPKILDYLAAPLQMRLLKRALPKDYYKD